MNKSKPHFFKRMKILWFSLSPCGSVRRFCDKRIIQGWMISLEDEIKKCEGVQLEVAFFSDRKEEAFVFEGVKYYPMYRNILDVRKGLNRIRERYVSQQQKDSKALFAMLDVVNQSQPDLIHIHGTEEAFGLIADYIDNIPIVFSIQGLIAPYAEKYFSGMPNKEIYKYESIKDKLKHISYRNEYKIFCYKATREIAYLQKARFVIGRTFWDEYITGLLNSHRRYYIVDEILRPPFYQVKWNRHHYTDGRYKIVSTISGGIYKGFETVLRTAFLLKQYSKLDFEWSIAGYNKDNKWVRIAERLTSIEAVDVNVVFKGRVDADDLSLLLSESDVYVHVSHIENSPNSVCEAMLVGMPVIASYAGGTGTLLENGEEGILVQDGDPYVYAGAIIELHNRFDLAKTFGERAFTRAMKRHNPQRIVSQLLGTYKEIEREFRKKG